MHKVFRYLKLSETPKGTFHEFFLYCETKSFSIFFVIPSMVHQNFCAQQMDSGKFELFSAYLDIE